jgi:hypothetical protein
MVTAVSKFCKATVPARHAGPPIATVAAVLVRVPSLLAVAAATVTATLAAAQPAAATPTPAQRPLRSWQVPAPGWKLGDKELGRVDDIVRVGRTVYLGGNFTLVSDHAGRLATRMHLAAVRAGTGALRKAFHPQINGRVYALAASRGGRFLFVGGQFTAVGGHPRHNLAAFDLRTGRLSTRLPDMRVGGPVHALAVSRSGRVYVGGSFGSIGGRRRSHLAKLVLRGGRYAIGRRFRAATNGDVRDIVLAPQAGRVLVAGGFTSVDGRSGQSGIAALGPGRGLVQPWASHPRDLIFDLALCGNRVYAAMGGPGGTALAYGLRGRRKWFYMTDGNVQAVTCVSHRPVFGMHGDYIAPHKNHTLAEYGSSKRILRHKLFMLGRAGVLRAWNPDLTSTAGVLGVWALASGRGNLYVGGDFTAVHGVTQQRFAILPHR